MGFLNEYPYTDFHELNLDWVLKRIMSLQEEMIRLFNQAVSDATGAAKAYTDEHIGIIENEFANLQYSFNALNNNFILVQAAVDNMGQQIVALKRYVDDQDEANRITMQLLIQQNNDYLLNQMEQFLVNVKVINYFTGEKVSIQDMFNYLAMLHLTDAITYATMASRAKTYTQLAALNINYTNLAMHGNTLYV